MIETELQYTITKTWRDRFVVERSTLLTQDQESLLVQLQYAALTSQIEEFEADIAAYEAKR